MKDPYEGLAGLDSRLYQDDEANGEESTNDEGTSTRARESASKDVSTRGNARSGARARTSSKKRVSARSSQRAREPVRTSASSRMGHRVGARVAERHSHDLFLDQIRWINRLKLDVEETYGARIAGNQLVQLAIDLIMEDYQRNGDQSIVIRSLVHGEDDENVEIVIAGGEGT